jgi:hypothetical protein
MELWPPDTNADTNRGNQTRILAPNKWPVRA